MLDFELKMKKLALTSNSSSWMDEILNEVSHAADQLEDLVAEHELSQKEILVNQILLLLLFKSSCSTCSNFFDK